ncbi:MAG: class II aldolase/adducin family protein, partial [Chloroflexi bacterium]|nr:class II aldolase/adducin family protein [Chloroflexota bacterium]
MSYQAIREQLLDTVIRATEVNLIHMSAGNKSTRTGDGLVAITPRGIKYREMTAKDISIIDLDGNLIEGPTPSSETPMHTAIYRHFPA